MEDAYLHYRAQGVTVIGIDVQQDTWGGSARFLARHGVTYPVGRDTSGAVGRMYRLAGLPTTYFIGADGRVRGVAVTGGFTGPHGARDLALNIERLLE